MRVSELPHLPKGLASTSFDAEGVATHPREVVKDGVLQGYFLGSYSARKLKLNTTGNAGGNPTSSCTIPVRISPPCSRHWERACW